MYRLELKSQPETLIGRLNMIVRAKSRPTFRGMLSLKNINPLTHEGVPRKLIGMLLKHKDEIVILNYH